MDGKNSTASVSCLTAPFLFSSRRRFFKGLEMQKRSPNPTMGGRQSQLQRCQCVTPVGRIRQQIITPEAIQTEFRGSGEWVGASLSSFCLRAQSQPGWLGSIPASHYCFLNQAYALPLPLPACADMLGKPGRKIWLDINFHIKLCPN